MKIPLLIACISSATAHGAIIIDNFTAALHDRFANNPTFIANGFDLSGVGRLSATASPSPNLILPWATLISSNVFIASSHTNPGGIATFFPGNNPNATPVTRTVTSTTIIAGSDITIGVLNAPVPSTIATYSYETQTISSINGAAVQGAHAYASGISPSTGAPYGATGGITNHSVGRNFVDGYSAGAAIVGRPTDVIFARYNAPTDFFPQPYTTYEALQQGGDSGAPLLVDDGTGNLRIIGIASAVGTSGSGSNQRDTSFYAYLGNYSDMIDEFVISNAVPEPSALGFLLLGGLCLQRRR